MEDSIKAFDNSIVIFILLFFIIEPDGISEGSRFLGGIWGLSHEFFRIARFIPFLASVPMFFEIRRPSLMLWLIFAYITVILVSCVLNSNLDKGFLYNLIKIASLSIITEYYMKSNMALEFVEILTVFLLFNIIVNLFTMIIFFPDGIYFDDRGWGYNYFLGFKNLHIYYFLPCMMTLAIVEHEKNRRLGQLYYICLSIIFVSCILNHSTTSLLTVIALSLLIYFCKDLKLSSWVNPTSLFVLFTIISAIVVFLGIAGTFTQYSENISEGAGKSGDTFASRTLLWIQALITIYKHPVIGSGNFSVTEGDNEYYQVHNQYLDIVTMGGIVLYMITFLQFVALSYSMKNIRKEWIFNVTIFVLISYFIEFLAEGKRNNYLWFVFLIVVYHIPSHISLFKKIRIHFDKDLFVLTKISQKK